MKKFYVIAMAAMIALGAAAAAPQANVKKSSFDKKQATAKFNMVKSDWKTLDGGVLQMATDEQRAANRMNRPKKAAPLEGEAYYKRPAGVFYASRSTEGYWFPSAPGSILFGKAFSPITYTANNADSYNWLAQMFTQDAQGNWAREWLSAEGVQAITMQYQEEMDSVPILSVGDGADYFNFVYKSGNQEHTRLCMDPDPVYWFAEGEEATYGYCLVSPKSFVGDRDDASVTYSSTYYRGADPDTDNGQENGWWFGHNVSGWNAMTLYLEKPENAFGLRSVFIDYTALKVNAGTTADLYVKIYKVAGRTNMEEDGTEELEYGEEIASGTVTIDENTPADGYLQVQFREYDAGAGDYIDVIPTIDDEVAIVVSGYDNSNIADFSMFISYDSWDEGYGQQCYMTHVDEAGGVPTEAHGMNDFFSSPLGYRAPSVFLDVINPYLVGNYTVETEGTARYFYLDGTVNTDSIVAMGFSETLAQELGNTVSLYSSAPVEDAVITDEYGNDLPDWLSVEILDEYENDEFTGTSTATINVQPATEGRACKVKINYPGAVYYIDVVQGEPSETPDLYVLGDFQGWKPNEGLKMQYDGQNYTATIEMETEGCIKFTTQLAETEEWTIDEYLWGAESEGDFVVVRDQMGADLTLKAQGQAFRLPAGEWKLTANLVDGTLVIEGEWPEEATYVAGSFTNWAEGKLAMTKGEDGLYVIEVEMEENAEFKFIDEIDKWYGGVTDGGNFIITEEQIAQATPLTLSSPGMNFVMPIAGTYKLIVDRENMTLVIEKVGGGLQGDVNGDGIVSGADVTALYNKLLDDINPAGNADVNGDGVVSGADVTALYNILLQ